MRIARRLTVLWVIATLVALGWPAEALPHIPTIGIDKVVHIAIYLVGTVVALIGWPTHTGRVLLILLFFAAFTEIWQALLPTNRHPSVLDAVANAVGLLGGWLVVRLRR